MLSELHFQILNDCLEHIQETSYHVGQRVYVPLLNEHARIKFINGNRVDVMTDSRQYMQTLADQIQLPFYISTNTNEETIKIPLKECSNPLQMNLL